MGCKQTKIVSSISQERLERSEVIDEVTSKIEAEISPKTTNVIRVDSEVTTDRIQVVEPLQETGFSSDISDEKITIYVHKALEIFLPDYFIDCYDETAETLPPCFRRTYIMQMKNNPDNRLYPDPTGKFLNHSIQPMTDRLHVCFNRDDPTLVKFLYQERAGRNVIVTSPFHNNDARVGSAVPCDQVPITKALHEDPIADIVKALGQIYSTSIAGNGFDGNDFLWRMHGSPNNFAISVYPDNGSRSLYWMSPETSRDGPMLMTDLESMMVHLELTQV